MTKKACVSSLVAATAGCVLSLSSGPAMAGMGDQVPTFGGTGMVRVASNGTLAFDLTDGRIVVVGMSNDGAYPVAINRFLATGLPDPSFGTGGLKLVDLPGIHETRVDAAALQPDEKLVIGGTHSDGGFGPYAARLTLDGTVDRTFDGGVGTLQPGTEPWYTSVLVMPNAEILLAISDWTSDRIDRYSRDGRYLGNLSAAIAPHRLAMQGDGRVIVSGFHRGLHQQVVMRIDAQGQLDQAFDTDGFAPITAGYDSILAVEPGSDRILLCGPSGVARLMADGHPDTTFGAEGNGYVTFGIGGVPAFKACDGLVPLQGGGVAYAVPCPDGKCVGGLTESGAVDTRFGAGRGFSTIQFGAVCTSSAPASYSSFVPTHDGNALLTALSCPDAAWVAEQGLLARIDLGNESLIASMPPAPAPDPFPTPTPTPNPDPTPIQRNGSGGGGAFGGLDVALLSLLAAAGIARRRHRRDEPPTR